MFPKGDILFNLIRVQRLFSISHQILHLSLCEKQNFKTASNKTISSTPYVGHINPSSSAGLHKLLRVSSYHFRQYWQFTSNTIISHACEDDIMFTCTLSGYSSPERVKSKVYNKVYVPVRAQQNLYHQATVLLGQLFFDTMLSKHIVISNDLLLIRYPML